MAPIGVWNQSDPQENAIFRSIAALPFLALLLWCFISLYGFGINTIADPYLIKLVPYDRIRVGATSIPTLNDFLDLKVFHTL